MSFGEWSQYNTITNSVTTSQAGENPGIKERDKGQISRGGKEG